MDVVSTRDLLVVIMIPLIVLTVRQIIANWSSLTDSHLTMSDRNLLKQAAMFLVLPVVVLLHELGHAVAIKIMGGQVSEFHYGLLWGYVIPSGGPFSSAQLLWIYLSGNLVQVMVGLICFLVAFYSKSPPVIALFTYASLWSIGETAVFYALMSIFGMYGDWMVIYTSPEKEAVVSIAISHFVIVAVLIYVSYSPQTRLWFAERTDPPWAKTHQFIEAKAVRNPTAENLLELGWSFYVGGLDRQARRCARQVMSEHPERVDPYLLIGWVSQSEGKTDEAIASFKKITENIDADTLLRTKAFLGIGQSEEERLYKLPRSKMMNTERWGNAIWAYTMAAKVSPDLADPLFHRAVLLNKAGLYDRAEVDLVSAEQHGWLDASLQRKVDAELAIARRGTSEEK